MLYIQRNMFIKGRHVLSLCWPIRTHIHTKVLLAKVNQLPFVDGYTPHYIYVNLYIWDIENLFFFFWFWYQVKPWTILMVSAYLFSTLANFNGCFKAFAGIFILIVNIFCVYSKKIDRKEPHSRKKHHAKSK